jgi:copper chaperone NosL
MAYQPPLIGFKQLLNFGAYSIPDTGGWIFVGAGFVLLCLVIYEWLLSRKQHRTLPVAKALALFSCVAILSSCTTGPDPISLGNDQCAFCKMNISDNRFGGELITRKGKVYKFDDAHCLMNFIGTGEVDKGSVAIVYFINFSSPHDLIKSDQAFLLKGELINGPMNGNIAAFSNQDSMRRAENQFAAKPFTWKQFNP